MPVCTVLTLYWSQLYCRLYSHTCKLIQWPRDTRRKSADLTGAHEHRRTACHQKTQRCLHIEGDTLLTREFDIRQKTRDFFTLAMTQLLTRSTSCPHFRNTWRWAKKSLHFCITDTKCVMSRSNQLPGWKTRHVTTRLTEYSLFVVVQGIWSVVYG